ncbi:MAG TPA: hypothetical protein VF753_08260 [Terriglobales bacterium]
MPQSIVASDGQNVSEQVVWRTSTLVAFRFAFCYLTLYMLYVLGNEQELVGYFVSGHLANSFVDPLWHRVVPWVGKHILHPSTDITIFTNGSGDTTYDYVLVLCELFVAAVGTVIWSVLDRKRSNYRRLYEWLTLAVALVLAMEMFSYGMDKLIPVRFGSLSLARLSKRVGEFSPMGLLWTFMAASKPYTIFAGFAEVLAGVLLLWPRLRTLGALVAIGAMSQVFALDMSYDVPVKLGSLHYLLMAAFLLVPDGKRLLNVLVLNRTAMPRTFTPLSNRKWVNRAAVILPMVSGVVWLAMLTRFSLKRYAIENPAAVGQSPLYGVWVVDDFSVTENSGPLLTDKLARQMHIGISDTPSEFIFDSPGALIIQFSNGVLDYTDVAIDQAKTDMTVSDEGDVNWKTDFAYQRSGDRLTLRGHMNGDAVDLRLHRLDLANDRLTSRGFHWINERPF